MRAPVAEPDATRCSSLEPRRVGLLARDREREPDVLLGGQHRQQVEELEDEADVLAPELRQLGVASSVVISFPAIVTVPEVGLSSPARMCISVDLPDPDGAHDRGQLALLDVQRDAAQGVDGRLALAVAPRHLAGDDDRAVLASMGRLLAARFRTQGARAERGPWCGKPYPGLGEAPRNPLGEPYDVLRRRRCASASTSPRMPTISSISASPATSGGEICTTGSPRSSARQIRPALEERGREEAAQQRLALGVVERLLRLLVLHELERVEEAGAAHVADDRRGRGASRARAEDALVLAHVLDDAARAS